MRIAKGLKVLHLNAFSRFKVKHGELDEIVLNRQWIVDDFQPRLIGGHWPGKKQCHVRTQSRTDLHPTKLRSVPQFPDSGAVATARFNPVFLRYLRNATTGRGLYYATGPEHTDIMKRYGFPKFFLVCVCGVKFFWPSQRRA